MINTDIPARHGETPVSILATAMQALGMIAMHSPQRRDAVSEHVDDIWNRLLQRGGGRDPLAVRCRLLALRRLGRFDKFEETCTDLHSNLRLAMEPEADLAVIPQLFSYLCYQARFQDALKVLTGFKGIKEVSLLGDFGSRDLITSACSMYRFTYGQRRRLLTLALRRIHPKLQESGPNAGSILSFLLEGDKSIDEACHSVLREPRSDSFFYSGLVRRLVMPTGPFVPPRLVKAAVHILEHHVPRGRMIAGSRFVLIWRTVVDTIAKSEALSVGERARLLERAVSVFPLNSESKPAHLASVIRSIYANSLRRGDAEGVQTAAHWWSVARRIPGGVPSERYQMHVVVKGFVQQGMPDVALDVVQLAMRWKSGAGNVRKILSLRETWTTPQFEDLLKGAGFTTDSGELKAELPRTVDKAGEEVEAEPDAEVPESQELQAEEEDPDVGEEEVGDDDLEEV